MHIFLERTPRWLNVLQFITCQLPLRMLFLRLWEAQKTVNSLSHADVEFVLGIQDALPQPVRYIVMSPDASIFKNRAETLPVEEALRLCRSPT